MKYETGQTYIIDHSRKGKFALEVTSQCEEWLSGIVVGGYANAIMDYNVKEKGESITVRKCFIKNETKAA